MANFIIPVAKKIYVCDDVVRDPVSGKVSVLNIWQTVRVSSFPHVLAKLCVFAQLRGGLGEIPFHIEIMQADTGEILRNPAKFVLGFADRTTRQDVRCKLNQIAFPSPGTYFVGMFCNGEFLDDQPIRVIAKHS